MSERGRARGRGRSRPAVPSDDGSAPSGAAGVTTSSTEVKFLRHHSLRTNHRPIVLFSLVQCDVVSRLTSATRCNDQWGGCYGE